MAWIAELLEDRVRDELEGLPLDMKARFRRIVELIQGYGLERVREPHLKHLTAKGRPIVVVTSFRQENPKVAQAGD